MTIHDYTGETFVAFMDICGFKKLMRTGKAWEALDKMYTAGYQVLKDNNQSRIEGLFISDSGILFVRRNNHQGISVTSDLHSLLSAVREINRKMLDADFMLTTSIAYGQFKYQERIEFVGIEKNPIYGNAYTSAYFDNASGSPKIQPGQCRLVNRGLPPLCDKNSLNAGQYKGLIRKRAGDTQHYYFYWHVKDPVDIKSFEERYNNSCKLKFQGMLEALRGH